MTIDDDLHHPLNPELPATRINRFVNDAIRVRLPLLQRALDEACQAVAREPWRKAEAREWEVTHLEPWPE